MSEPFHRPITVRASPSAIARGHGPLSTRRSSFVAAVIASGSGDNWTAGATASSHAGNERRREHVRCVHRQAVGPVALTARGTTTWSRRTKRPLFRPWDCSYLKADLPGRRVVTHDEWLLPLADPVVAIVPTTASPTFRPPTSSGLGPRAVRFEQANGGGAADVVDSSDADDVRRVETDDELVPSHARARALARSAGRVDLCVHGGGLPAARTRGAMLDWRRVTPRAE